MITRPLGLFVAAGVVALEALALAVISVVFVVVAIGAGNLGTSLVALAVMFLLLGVCLFGVALGLFRMRRWARPASVAWQVLMVLGGFAAGQWIGVVAIVLAALGLVSLFLPSVVRFYEANLGRE
ncbi:hypothetical protein [Brevibacterium samyangense]|uniref:Histidine kinase n=1 Tax=Brevibacterium samyangense TaxID=366888 RepID=A0ABN2TJR7_9MICO